MEQKEFSNRLIQLRMNKGVSARDMSLSLGQSPGYINNIENCVNYPSMATFFYICEYLNISPQEFFDATNTDPEKIQQLLKETKGLSSKQLDLLISLAQEIH